MATAAGWRVSGLKSQKLTKTAWTFVTLSRQDGKLCAPLARAAERRLDEFHAQGLGHTAWALAKAGQSGDEPFAQLAVEAAELI